jgi:hypothetical protein
MSIDRVTLTLDESEFVELVAAMELALAAARLVPGADSEARCSTITELIDLCERAWKDADYRSRMAEMPLYEQIASCDLCGRSDDHVHSADEWGVFAGRDPETGEWPD